MTSGRAISAVQAIESADVFLQLMEISHPNIATPYRLVMNTEDVFHRGETFTAYPFEIVYAMDDGERLPEVSLTIDNVDRMLIEMIRTLVDPPKIRLMLVLAEQLDTIEIEVKDLMLRNVTYDAYTITGKLYADDILNARFPEGTIDLSSGYEGIFK